MLARANRQIDIVEHHNIAARHVDVLHQQKFRVHLMKITSDAISSRLR
jgi:hypothetical protein